MSTIVVDNRNLEEVNAYLEARVEALADRVRKLEAEQVPPSSDSENIRWRQIAEERQQTILDLEKLCSELQEQVYRLKGQPKSEEQK